MKSRSLGIFKALANRGRLMVYQAICRRRVLTIGGLVDATGFRQPSVSHHVDRLARAGLVRRTRRGSKVECRPRGAGLGPLRNFLLRSMA